MPTGSPEWMHYYVAVMTLYAYLPFRLAVLRNIASMKFWKKR